MRHKRALELGQPVLASPGQAGLSRPRSGLVEAPGDVGIQVAARMDAGPARRTAGQPYWMAIYFPDLALDALEWLPDGPRVVVVERHNRREVFAACERAQAAGILPGIPLGTALALCADLVIRVRDNQLEQQYLRMLAECCLRITPTVCLELPDVLLMEVRGSLHMFGGADTIRQQLKSWMRSSMRFPTKRGASVPGGRLFFAATPTPGASTILARSTLEYSIEELDAITSALGELPVRSLLQSWPDGEAGKKAGRGSLPPADRLQRQLDDLGIRTVRELFRLPRDGLRRRFGSRFVEGMDKILGVCPDIRTIYRSQLRFSDALDLEMETDNTLWIATACEVLLDRFAAYLYQHDAMASRILLQLRHPGRDDTKVCLGHATGSRSKAEWMCLLNIHLDRQRLVAPVTAIELSGSDIYPYRAHTPDLFGRTGTGWDTGSWNRTLDEIRVRLGADALAGFLLRADHRPEYAYNRACKWAYNQVPNRAYDGTCNGSEIPDEKRYPSFPDRPGWLLSRPRPLNSSPDNMPGPPGDLDIVSRPERIESGWWDDRNVRRDYYVAVDSSHRSLWIFRDLESGGWYLHGLFA